MYKQPKNKKYYRHSKNYDFWLKSEGDKFTIAHRLEWDFEVNRIYQQHIVGDFNGDGHPECMRLDVDDKWYMYYPFLSRTSAESYNKITRISQDNGVYTSITYSNLTDNHIYQRAQLNKASQPHAISGIDNDNGVVKSLFLTTTNTPFRKPDTIIDDHKSDSIKTYHIFYSPDNERIKSVYSLCDKDIVTTYYLPDYEVEIANGATTTRHYIFSPATGHLAAVHFKQGNKSETYYAITDHQGSVLKLVDNKVHSKYEARYTPFGVRTIVKNDLGYNFPRGYTMHEHLDQFGVINANARLYDPYLARFMSPDPYIQEPTNPQNFNRFSYCLNNPLKYTDPTGEFWWLTALNIGINALSNGFAYKKAGQSFWQGFGRGVVSGVATANVGSAISYGGILSRGFTMAGVNVLTNGVDNLINDKRFFNNYQVAAFSGFATGALEGFFISKETGKNMWWGNDIGNGRTQWAFFNSNIPFAETIADNQNPYVSQNALWNCGCACVESITNGEITQDQMRQICGGDPNTKGIEDLDLMQKYSTLQIMYGIAPYRTVTSEYSSIKNITLYADDIAQYMNNGSDFLITLRKEKHMVVLNKIVKYTSQRHGYTHSWFKYYVMNPSAKEELYIKISPHKLVRLFHIHP